MGIRRRRDDAFVELAHAHRVLGHQDGDADRDPLERPAVDRDGPEWRTWAGHRGDGVDRPPPIRSRAMFRSPLAVLATSRAVRAAMALAVVLAVAVWTSATPAARAMGALPACRYDDILTTPRKYTAWSTTLVDTILRVPSTYAPPDLVSTSEAGLSGGGQVREVAIADLMV